MKTQTPKNPGSALSLRLADLRSRLDLSPAQMADYLGVPIHTLRKWETGERGGSATLLRLLDVLGIVEALAPAIHESLIPDAHVGKVPRKSSRHVEKVPAKSDAHVGEVPAKLESK